MYRVFDNATQATGQGGESRVARIEADPDLGTATLLDEFTHPDGLTRRLLDRVEEALELPETSMAVSRATMREFGNIAAQAVLGVLAQLQSTRPLAPGQHGVALAFGPGATIWAMLLPGA
ncbi:hypothetical protein O7599_07160 [Streptomyces sp. WMMC500]|uniref:3-oxoacyl-[acyl-carrier-protein] synthase III C-terminal domain-containing protein n=1 Tax=Streptomyces sp. WMMC500 TaxID=3015154 RepID=UPI00248B041A|nr:3-oxoacyl-[acyl-carrier-protein] synthase III C-terminal domain-containing protein [Streptomyces sp. WMMC500]WBB62302.1 hypothetical protein O7599_07160 [Streptomyces sp. WMMC500]